MTNPFFHAALGLCSAVSLAAMAAPPPQAMVIYGDDAYPPYSYAENGQMKGIYTEIVRQALQTMPQYQVQLRPVPWKRGVLMLQTGEAFALYPPYAVYGERPTVSYSVPLMTEQVAVFCNRDVVARRKLAHWPADYRGLRIGLNAGSYVGDAGYKAAVKAGTLVVDAAKGTRTNMLKLMRGRIDCYINDRLAVQWELQRIRKEGLQATSMLAIEETAQLASQQVYLGFSQGAVGPDRPDAYPYRADFVARFNAAILQMRQSGAIGRIVEHALQP